jgi:hypothetical protein
VPTKRKYNRYRVVCDKCGKEAPLDTAASTPMQPGYKLLDKCQCGGEWVTEFVGAGNVAACKGFKILHLPGG